VYELVDTCDVYELVDMYIYIYIYICVCVCQYGKKQNVASLPSGAVGKRAFAEGIWQ
jgi:hypothetical protein